MKRGLSIALLLLMLGGCQSGSQSDRFESSGGGSGGSDDNDLLAEPADRQTRAKAHTELAGAYYELGNMGVSLEETRIALKADPNYAPAYNIQGLVRLELRDYAAAEESFRRGLQLNPDDPDLNHNFGWFHCQTGKVDQAMPWFMKAIQNPLYRNPSRTWAVAARCVQQTRPEQALEYYERAIKLDPNNPAALLSFADFQYRSGQLPEARSLLLRYKKLVADPNAESLWLGVRLERKLGDKTAEASYGAQLRNRFPNSPQYQALRAGRYD